MSSVRKDDAEQARIAYEQAQALLAGDEKRARELAPKVQLETWAAECFKTLFGAQWLRDKGYDVSLAEEELGPGWLDRDEGPPLITDLTIRT